MRKIFSVTVAAMLAATMLTSSALAQGAKGPKDNMGADRGQKNGQTDSVLDAKTSYSPDHAAKENKHQRDQEVPAEDPVADGTGITGDTGNSDAQEIPDKPKKDKESKRDEKPVEDLRNGKAYGRVRNTQEVLEAIGQLTGDETAAQLNTLLTAYRAATDKETARAALTTLLDALSQACLGTVSNEIGTGTETQEPITYMNIERLREKVLENAGNDNGTLLALMHAYENALLSVNQGSTGDTNTDVNTGAGTIPDNG